MDDEEQLALLRDQYSNTVGFIQRLVDANKVLAAQLEEKTLDHDSATFACRTAQRELQKLQEKESRILKNRYAMTLIDGDGMIVFKEELLRKGRAGGTEAGRLMLQELSSKLAQTSAAGADLHIKIFANVTKLAAVLYSAGRTEYHDTFWEFVVGFTQTREHVYFIDVGDGKEMVDSRIRAELNWHLECYSCQKVLLGVSHDNGYARVLSSILSDGNSSRILLLEGTPTASEVRQLPYETTKLPKLFESRKLRAPKMTMPTKPVNPSSTPASSGSCTPPKISSSEPAIPSGPRRPFVSTTPKVAMARIKALRPPPCNDFYILGNCQRGTCLYSHAHDLNDLDIQAMRIRVGAFVGKKPRTAEDIASDWW